MSDAYAAPQNGNSTRRPGDPPLEKDYGNGNGYHEHLDTTMSADDALKRVHTAGSISISPELFEKIYLSPQNRVAGELRKTFGNPTPVALVGFLLTLTPVAIALMGWRGAGAGSGNANALNGVVLGMGAILMLLGGLGEWILGNTFPAVVFLSFGGFWVAFGLTNLPYINAAGAYELDAEDPGFNATFGFWLLLMGVLCFVYMICALRTNIVFFLIFLILLPTFGLLAAGYFLLAMGEVESATNCIIGGGATAFVVSCLGLYIFVAIMLAGVDFPIALPVGDLSNVIKGATDRRKVKEAYSA